jgi:hypothetical protein
LEYIRVKLLLVVLCVTYFSSLRSNTRELPGRVVPTVLMCILVAVAYLSQRVI